MSVEALVVEGVAMPALAHPPRCLRRHLAATARKQFPSAPSRSKERADQELLRSHKCL